ncbi:MAG: PKD domain-containing protein, partial [SAR202 cluster bacterium]|nr:PKD domain-containing protein [SAR202 cluster bacterium]
TVVVTVNDGFGGAGSDSLTLTVDNAPPTVLISSLRSESVGRIGLWPATYTDPGALDTHTAIIDWGDGATTTGIVNADKRAVMGSHTYTDAGNYTVTVTVTDDDGGSGSDTFAVAIDATPTVVAIPSIGAWGLLLLTLVLALGLLVRTRVSNRSA